MYQVFIGSLMLSIIHALIPNHWLPLIAVGKTEKWGPKQALWATIVTGAAHSLSTVMIGIVVGLVGYRLSAGYSVISETIAPAILVGLGIIYIMLGFRHHNHHHGHQATDLLAGKGNNKSGRAAILASLSMAMFLTPCVEIEAYYFQAGTICWIGIFIVSAVYVVTTLVVMVFLVTLGMKGASLLISRFPANLEKTITGLVLVALGILAFRVKF
ncbi:MAG: hypothetical protein WCK34_01160 [Bacteroidota bacterium]